MDNIAYVVKIGWPDDKTPWDIGGIFDEQKYALELKEYLEETFDPTISVEIIIMSRNTAYV